MCPAPLIPGASLWLQSGEQSLAGRGRIALLRSVAELGSISAAARAMGMSYKTAWDAIDSMNNLAGQELVARSTGGRGGGGARVTAQGLALIAAWELAEQAHRRFVADLGRALGDTDGTLSILERLRMKTSARNQFHGRITRIQRGAVNDEITLDIGGGTLLVATITHDSTTELALTQGADVVALVKAPWVLLATGEGLRVSTRNCLRGTVARITRGAVNSEVALTLTGGSTLVAIIINESVDDLALREGGEATALINASHILLAVPA
jgi:molybdate transport system regulatory protein